MLWLGAPLHPEDHRRSGQAKNSRSQSPVHPKPGKHLLHKRWSFRDFNNSDSRMEKRSGAGKRLSRSDAVYDLPDLFCDEQFGLFWNDQYTELFGDRLET